MQNKVFTTLNQPLGAQIYSISGPDGDPQPIFVLEGFPLGTHDNSETGELGGKVIVIATRGPGAPVDPALNSGMPYNADEQDITNATAGPTSIIFKRNGTTLFTRTITYVDSSVSGSPVTMIQDA